MLLCAGEIRFRSMLIDVTRLESWGCVEREASMPFMMTDEPPETQIQRSFMPVHASMTGTSKSKVSTIVSENA